MKDYSTVFPTSIDSRCFFQDVSIDKLPIMEKYNSMIIAAENSSGPETNYAGAKGYTAASEYINAQNVSFYGAWFLNMMEERLYALENYLVYDVEKPDIVKYSDTEPTEVPVGYCWT